MLLAGFAEAMPDFSGAENILAALADLCAVAIRQARLRTRCWRGPTGSDGWPTPTCITGLANK